MPVMVTSSPPVDEIRGADGRLQEDIRSRIAQRWPTYFPTLATGPSPEIVCERGPHARGFSVMMEYELKFAARSEHVLAKVRRDSRFGAYLPAEVTTAPELLRLEFDELSRAHSYFSSQANGLRVVRPFDYFTDLNAVLIEKASGSDLGVLARTDRAQGLAAFRMCGLWLRAFHERVHATEVQHWSIEEFEGRLMRRREKLLALGVQERQLDPLLRQVLDGAAACRQRDVPCSMLHGDFKMRHIWASRGSIQVFDFGNVHQGPCYVDVAAFLVELSVMRLGHPWFDRQRVAQYTQTFLHAYFGAQRPPLLNLYVIEALLKKWMRRRRTWGRSASASKLHSYVRRIGAESLAEHWYIDRWFIGGIRESLDTARRAGRQVTSHHA